jgi:hypothetical protein
MRPKHVPHLASLLTNLRDPKDGLSDDESALIRRLAAPLWIEGRLVEDDSLGIYGDDASLEALQVTVSQTQKVCQ